MKTTARINTLPPDLRAIANDMLAVKFPEKYKDFNGLGDILTTQSTLVATELTEKSLNDAIKMIKEMPKQNPWVISQEAYRRFYDDRLVEMSWPRNYGKTNHYKEMYEKMMVETIELNVNPMYMVSADFGFEDE